MADWLFISFYSIANIELHKFCSSCSVDISRNAIFDFMDNLIWEKGHNLHLPGATPKNPASGLMARNLPSLSNLIHAMSSPTQVTLYPCNEGFIMARLVLPQAEGKAAAMYFFSPLLFSRPRI